MFENLTPQAALPSLNALRAFEAMGRTGSATLAAAELHVTHSAVSRQVKALEAALGIRLFEGPRHQLRLTKKGRALSLGLGTGFDALTEAVRIVRDIDEVHVAIHPSLAVKWLIPRLARFERECPGVTLHLSDLAPAATRQRGADLVVRYLDGPDLGQEIVEHLFDNRVGVVCTPAMAAGELATAPRLAAKTHIRGWSDWVRATGHSGHVGPVRALTHLHFVQDAALASLGLAVLPQIIVADDLATGRLVAPYGFTPDGGALAAIRMDTGDRRAVGRTVNWLRAQAQATAKPDHHPGTSPG